MAADKDKLSKRGRRARKKAKKTAKLIQHNEGTCETIADSILATNGVPPSQVLAYEKKKVKNKSVKHHSSQDDVRMYRNGHKTEADDD